MSQNENIEDLIKNDINFLGLIQYKKSPRYVALDTIDWGRFNKSKVKPVAVFVDASTEEIASTLAKSPIDIVQLHGKETPETCRKLQELGFSVIKAFGVDSEFDWTVCKDYCGKIDLFLFDTKSKKHGGTGVKFDWDLLKSYPFEIPFLLSGGISSGDLSTLKNNHYPKMIGVDVNSRFEVAPGIKDIPEINRFVKHLRDLNTD
ncbi:phosphoribosylanthranilate isomerase [Prolixibacteraceae bacterium]|nr:phosphoribosylanthranilate isomerase [Prolixibacteraceae bacterium]